VVQGLGDKLPDLLLHIVWAGLEHFIRGQWVRGRWQGIGAQLKLVSAQNFLVHFAWGAEQGHWSSCPRQWPIGSPLRTALTSKPLYLSYIIFSSYAVLLPHQSSDISPLLLINTHIELLNYVLRILYQIYGNSLNLVDGQFFP